MLEPQSFTHCLTELRAGDHDRYLTLLYAPAAVRPGLAALYLFNLELSRVRGQVSEPMTGLIRYAWWRETLESALSGTPRAHPAALALAALPKGAVAADDLEPLIAAREDELEMEAGAAAAPEAMEAFAAATSGRLAALAVRLCLGGRDETEEAKAAAAGTGWGLVRLLEALAREAAAREAAAEGLEAPVELLRAGAARAEGLLGPVKPASRLALAPMLLAVLARARLQRLRARAFKPEDPAAGAAGRQLRLLAACALGRA